MERRTGKTETQVSHEFASLALYLEIHHPLLCLRRAEQGWMQFWGEPTWSEVEWPPGRQGKADEFLMTMANFLVREVEAAFLVLALLSIPCALFRLKAFTKLEYLIFRYCPMGFSLRGVYGVWRKPPVLRALLHAHYLHPPDAGLGVDHRNLGEGSRPRL